MKKTILFGVVSAVLLSKNTSTRAQENPWDTLTTSIQKIQNDMDLFKRIKISGYIQPQFQYIDSLGAPTFAGGNFHANTDKRFMLRRARIKITHTTSLSEYVFQIDAIERGFTIRDMYLKLTEPWIQAFSLTFGCMNRPFGFEVPYSSSNRESLERGRMSQIIFPGERDLGAMLTFQMPKTSRFNFLKIEGGMFNGTGAWAVDFDYQKDFIGNIGINKTTKNEKINYTARVSYYNGGFRQGTSKVFKIASDSLGLNAFLQNKDTVNYGAIGKREYVGFDAQVNIDWIAGITTLRGEFIQGQQPGTSSTSISPSTQPTVDTYIRNFNGAYFYFLQNIAQTKHQLILKYDWYDPNTDVEGDDIGKTVTPKTGKTFARTNATDIKYTTIGVGWAYRWNTQIKFTAYYDMVTNETSKNLTRMSKDLPDNVLTLRLQYKF